MHTEDFMINGITKFGREVIEKKVIEMYVVEKLGAPTIGEKLEISKPTVYRILEKHNIQTRKRKAHVQQEVVTLFNTGMTISQLSNYFRLQERTIKILLTQDAQTHIN